MQVVITPKTALRFGKQSADSVTPALTLETLQKALEDKKTLKDTGNALQQAPVAVIIKEEKKEETVYKKARDLSNDEKIALLRNSTKPFTPWYKSFKTPIWDYTNSPRWEAVKNGHYGGFLGSTFGSLAGFVTVNAEALAHKTANIAHTLTSWTPIGQAFGDGHLSENFTSFLGDHSTPYILGGGAIVGIGSALTRQLSAKKENEDYEALMQMHPEKATKFNLLSDERVKNIKNQWDENKTDNNIERGFMNLFTPSTAMPSELQSAPTGWVFPWNLTTLFTKPVSDLPIGRQIHDAVVAAQGNDKYMGRNSVPTLSELGAIPGQTYGLAKNLVTSPYTAVKQEWNKLAESTKDERAAAKKLASGAKGLASGAKETAANGYTLGRFINAIRQAKIDPEKVNVNTLNNTLLELELKRTKKRST